MEQWFSAADDKDAMYDLGAMIAEFVRDPVIKEKVNREFE